MEPNPFDPPPTPLANPPRPVVSPERRFWWVSLRWLPVACCGYLTGGCGLISGLQLATLAELLATGRQAITPGRSHPLVAAAAFPVFLALTALGVRTVRHWYRCRWKWAALTTLIFLVLLSLSCEALDRLAPIRSLAPPAAKPRNQTQP